MPSSQDEFRVTNASIPDISPIHQGVKSWHDSLAEAIRDSDQLLDRLRLPESLLA